MNRFLVAAAFVGATGLASPAFATNDHQPCSKDCGGSGTTTSVDVKNTLNGTNTLNGVVKGENTLNGTVKGENTFKVEEGALSPTATAKTGDSKSESKAESKSDSKSESKSEAKTGDNTNTIRTGDTNINNKQAASTAFAAGGPAHAANGCLGSSWSVGLGGQTFAGGGTINFSGGVEFKEDYCKFLRKQWEDAKIIDSGTIGGATIMGTWIKADPAKLETANEVAEMAVVNPHQKDPIGLLLGVPADAPKEQPKPGQRIILNKISVTVNGAAAGTPPATTALCETGSRKGMVPLQTQAGPSCN